MHPYCGDCPRRASDLPGHKGAVPAWGRNDAPVLVVGMSPGKDELALGVPFVGPSGALLKAHGAPAGLFREDCRIVNTVECWPAGGRGGKTLTPGQLSACRPRLEQELAAFGGEVILCLGAEAFDAVTGLITWEKVQNKAAVRGVAQPDGSPVKAKPVGIGQWRGYLIAVEDAVPVLRTVTRRSQDHFYKVAGPCPQCKGFAAVVTEACLGVIDAGLRIGDIDQSLKCDYCLGTGRRKKGDPKLEEVEVEVPRHFPSSVRWIVGTYHPSFVMRTGMKVLPAFVNDVGRLMRALRGELELVDMSYEERLP